MNIKIRGIGQKDDETMAAIIRQTLTEFGANQPGTVYFDAATDHLSELFREPLSFYFVVTINEQLMGGGGIYPTPGLPAHTCELVKMYLLPAARGKGIGKLIIDNCLQKATEFGFKNVYLETMPELEQAMNVYEKFGFKYLARPLGSSGHFGCSKWMLKTLQGK